MKIIDAKGMLCPKPLILTKKEIEKKEEKEFTVIVDNETAVENLKKFSENSKYDFSFEKKSEKEFFVTINVNETCELCEDFVVEENIVISFSKDFMGNGSEELGRKLVNGFIYTATEYEKLPKTLVFFNSGVKLTTEGSECIDDLKKLEEKGVKIISCGTCLDFYGVKEKLLVGEISNMYNIYETVYNADKVINI